MEFENQEQAEAEVKRLRTAMKIAGLLLELAIRTPKVSDAIQRVKLVQSILDDQLDPETALPLP